MRNPHDLGVHCCVQDGRECAVARLWWPERRRCQHPRPRPGRPPKQSHTPGFGAASTAQAWTCDPSHHCDVSDCQRSEVTLCFALRDPKITDGLPQVGWYVDRPRRREWPPSSTQRRAARKGSPEPSPGKISATAPISHSSSAVGSIPDTNTTKAVCTAEKP